MLKEQNEFAILRIGKIKSYSKLGLAENHNLRKMNVHNANADLSHNNQRIYGSDSSVDLVKRRIEATGVALRKDSVLLTEMILTFSPGMAEKVNESHWTLANLEWLRSKFGDNLIALDLHLDETTPHIHAIITPIIEEAGKRPRLTAKDFWGERKGLSELQTEYASKMERFELKRGLKKAKPKSQKIKRYYSIVDAAYNIDYIKNRVKKLRRQVKTPQYNLTIGFVSSKRVNNDFAEFSKKMDGVIGSLAKDNRILAAELREKKIELESIKRRTTMQLNRYELIRANAYRIEIEESNKTAIYKQKLDEQISLNGKYEEILLDLVKNDDVIHEKIAQKAKEIDKREEDERIAEDKQDERKRRSRKRVRIRKDAQRRNGEEQKRAASNNNSQKTHLTNDGPVKVHKSINPGR